MLAKQTRDHTNETSRDGKFQVIRLGKQSGDSAEDGFAPDPALLGFGDDARPNFDFVSQLQNTRQDRAAGNTALQIVNLGTSLVDVNDRMTIMWGVAVKSRIGTGILLTRASLMALMLNLSWAEMGMVGDQSAMVPRMNWRIDW